MGQVAKWLYYGKIVALERKVMLDQFQNITLRIAKHKAMLETAKLRWPEIDVARIRILPVSRNVVDITDPDGRTIGYERIRLGAVGSFVMGYGRRNKVLAIKCQFGDGYAEPCIVSDLSVESGGLIAFLEANCEKSG